MTTFMDIATPDTEKKKREITHIRSQNGKLYINFSYPKGCPQRVPTGLNDDPKGREAAKKLAAKVTLAIQAGIFSREMYFPDTNKPVTKTTVESFGKTWVDSLAHELNTMRSYRTSLKKIYAWFGGVELKDLLPIQIQRELKKCGLSPKTQKNYVCVLSALYTAAIDNKLTTFNPCSKVKLPKLPLPESTINPLERSEMALIFDYFGKKDEQYFNLVSFMLETGLRPQEVPLLTYYDIDFTNRTIRVNKAVDADQSEKGTKTGKARLVDLTDRAIAALNAQKKHTYKNVNSLIFLGIKSKRQIHMRVFRVTVWNPCLKKLGIKPHVLYSLRHTFGSQLVSDGLPMKYVSEQLGHSSITTTERHYAKWMVSSNSKILELRNKGNGGLLKLVAGGKR